MAQQSVCAHCGFRNFSASHLCARCEQPLRDDAAKDAPGRPKPRSLPTTNRPAAARAPALGQATAPLESDGGGGGGGDDRTQIVATPPPRPRPAPPAAPPPVRRLRDAAEARDPWRPPTQGGPMPPSEPRAPTEPTRLFDAPALAPGLAGTPQVGPHVQAPPPAYAGGGQPPTATADTQVGEMAGLRDWRPTNMAALRREPNAPNAPAMAAAPAWDETRTGQAAPASAAAAATADPHAARLWRRIAAMGCDGVVLLAAMLAYAALEMWLVHGSWPSERATGLEALAWWLYVYHRNARRILLVGLMFAALYLALGVRTGVTVGRLAFGLKLVEVAPQRARQPQTAAYAPWATAGWHLVGCALCLLSVGAGIYWMVVDARGRTWANFLSRTVVVRRA